MKGSLRLKDGIFYAVISYKDNLNRYKQKWISTGLKERGNKKHAQKILNDELEKFKNSFSTNQDDTSLKNNNIIFMDYIKSYIDEKQNSLSPSTIRGYLSLWKQMSNFFGFNLKLQDVTYKHLLAFYDYLKNERGVKNISIKRHKEILSPALRLAYRDDLITKNPYEFMPKLKREKSKKNFYDIDEIEKLFAVTDKTKIGLIVRIACYYGFRRSEILGLRWQSIDFKHNTITIENKVLNINKKIIASEVLKTLSSNRTLPLIVEIKDLLLKRKDEIDHNKDIYGKNYSTQYLDYVFVDDLGNLYLPDYVSHLFSKILKKNNLKHIRFHDLRHSCASLLVNKNVPMKNIQEWLGHSSYNLTADTYSHLNYESKIQSSNVISQTLSKASPNFSKSNLQVNQNSEQNKTNTINEILEIHKKIKELENLIEKKKQEMDFEM